MATPDDSLRVGDAERSQAIAELGDHYAQGRINLEEYEERSKTAAQAKNRHDLLTLFEDLPALTGQATVEGNTGQAREMQVYSAKELQSYHREGSKIKDAIMGISSISIVAFSIGLNGIWSNSALLILLIPIIAILLYVAKVGPSSWHQPSPEQLEKKRLAALRTKQKLLLEERKQERRQKRDEMTHTAMEFVTKNLKKRTKD